MESPFISLGGNCAVSYQLNDSGLKEESYPFDWCEISIQKIIKVLEKKFKNYENIEIIRYSETHIHLEETKGSFLLKNGDGIKFAHELKNEEELEEFKNSISRRIKRFLELKNPIFVRIETKNLSKEQMKKYKQLEDILDKYFTNYKIRLISKEKYESEKTKWFSLEKFSADWTYPNIDWNKIFE
jgi:hypothetical protein